MGPEISTNIGSMLRAMENVVMPAIDPDNKLAQEQSYLLMVYLRLLADQHDKIFHFRLQEIREYHTLVSDILRISSPAGNDDVKTAAQMMLDASTPILDLELPGYEQLANLAQNLRQIADDLTRAVVENRGSTKATSEGLAELLLTQANREALRERAWVTKLGIDPELGTLPSLAELLVKKRC